MATYIRINEYFLGSLSSNMIKFLLFFFVGLVVYVKIATKNENY